MKVGLIKFIVTMAIGCWFKACAREPENVWPIGTKITCRSDMLPPRTFGGANY